MNRKLQSLYDSIETERLDITEQVKKLPDKELNRKPAEGKWSVLQIIFHLVKTEKIAVISIQKGIQKKEKHAAWTLRSLINNALLNIILKTPVKIKAPPIVAKVPDTYNLNELLVQWEKSGKALKETAEEFTPELMEINVFPHSYLGDMNITKTFKFILEHLKHHKRQIYKIHIFPK
ncbi:MAG: DinB family protein [Ignavibacteriaceae bacterium]